MRLALFVPFSILLLRVGVASPQVASPSGGRIDLPVRAVTLFSSGVGYFEHAGTVHGDGSAELRFKTDQINDILKSLMLQDQDGGHVAAITYPSQDPISKTLRSFQVDITSNPTMASLLNQLRGARITVQSQAEKISGTILGVEERERASGKDESMTVSTLNLLSGATIRSLELPAISALSLDDPQLQDELTKALVALSQARDQDKKPVTISFLGNGERRVRIGYVVETPIWKTSYRLMLDEKGARIQGWAIVENQTESDWTNVSLSLVSGRPISFMMDLYQPLYLRRPTVVPELLAGLTPQAYEAGTTVVTGDMVNRLPADRITQALAAQPGRLVARDAVTTKQTVYPNGYDEASITTGTSSAAFGNAQAGIINIADRTNTVRSMATAARLGALFQYTVPNVTLARQKSAMLPIVTDSVGVERLSIYNAAVLPRNPLNGVRLRNTTGKHFLQGPVTVLDKGAYAGDSRIDDVPPGQERLLSYGADLDLFVDNTKSNQYASVVTGKIIKGALIISRKLVSSQEYLVDNKGTRERTIVIEHPVRFGWKLVDSIKPIETTPSVYRFQGKSAPGKVMSLVVREESVRDETMTVLPAGIAQLLTYSRSGEIPSPVRDALTRAIQLKQGVVDLDGQVATRTSQITDITREQERIRENMKTVESKSQYYDRLLAKLNEQESSIERLQKERDDLLARRDVQQKALEDYVLTLTVG